MDNTQTDISHLSDLHDGESAVICKVNGYGAFRKRISEMGFVYGTVVKVIKRAPLQNPVEYELMGYRVSLRNSEAAMIEICDLKDFKDETFQSGGNNIIPDSSEQCGIKPVNIINGKTIKVALVGNPNCGKTTLFNHATGRQEKVANYSGVTVDVKSAYMEHNGYHIEISDLPGTYSISEYSPEELFVRRQLTISPPDVVVNVIDSSNLERNLFLTTQLIDMNIKVVIALNMFDELEKSGKKLDYIMLGKMLGIPVIPTIASKGKGIKELIDKIIELYAETEPTFRHFHINYGNDINNALEKIKDALGKGNPVTDKFHGHYVAVKLLENDKSFIKELSEEYNETNVIEVAKKETAKLEEKYHSPGETIIADAKYAFIRGALKETYKPAEVPNIKGYLPDKLLTGKWLGFPLFLIFMWAIFQTTFSLGNYPMHWIEKGIEYLGLFIGEILHEGMLHDLLIDGILGGVGGVIVFLPNILILFFCISLLEDSGYMARAAFIMDRIMHKIGLHGKSFIPMLMGFGCNVPAIMATRTMESRKDRIVTMMIIPFMSCSARLPIYILLVSLFFEKNKGLVLLSIYLAGIVIAALTSILLNKTVFRKEEVPFVMELPPYRRPTLKSLLSGTWNKGVHYLTKMGTVILLASIIIWAAGYFPRSHQTSADPETAAVIQVENSYIGQFGHFISPVLEPLGYNWKTGISILTGMAAKEIIVSSMGVLYNGTSHIKETLTPLTAYSLMLFILLYFPCIATLAAIQKEAGTKWALFSAFYTTLVAWIISFAIYQIGGLFL